MLLLPFDHWTPGKTLYLFYPFGRRSAEIGYFELTKNPYVRYLPEQARPASTGLFMQNVHIYEDYRGLGHGKQMMREAIELAHKNLELEFISLTVEPHNLPAMKIYSQLGFQEIGVPVRDSLYQPLKLQPMRLDLNR